MVVAIFCGATATGKSALALRLALANGFEIISADSRQIYDGPEIGTNLPTREERDQVPHHLISFLDPSVSFSPREFPGRVKALLEASPRSRFLIVGGTGLYLKELLFPARLDRGPTPEAIRLEVQARLARDGLASMHEELLRLDPEGGVSIHPHDRYRIVKRWENFLITGESYTRLAGAQARDGRFAGVPMLCLEMDREALYRRIGERVEAMVRGGWEEEVKRLMADPGWETFPAFSSLGYREMAAAVMGRQSLESAVAAIQKKTRNYAKRQSTFFRNQFPFAHSWNAERLEAALDACHWSWEVFAERHLHSHGEDASKPSASSLP